MPIKKEDAPNKRPRLRPKSVARRIAAKDGAHISSPDISKMTSEFNSTQVPVASSNQVLGKTWLPRGSTTSRSNKNPVGTGPAKKVKFIDDDDLDELFMVIADDKLKKVSSSGTRGNPIDLRSDTPDIEHEVKKPVLRECGVCGDEWPLTSMPVLMNCSHRSETCADCFSQWIASELDVKGWKGITCPVSKCTVALEHHEVREYSTAEVFTRYDAFAMREVLGQDPNFIWCRRAGCGSGQIQDADGYIFTCAKCGYKMCTIHNVDWHEGETCQEYTYRVSGQKERDDIANEEACIKLIEKTSKKCPGPGCNYNIEKNNGCDHMTCSRCRYEFCWLCLADYNEIRYKGNAFHRPHCRLHSSRLRY